MDDEEFKPDPGADDADDVYVPGADEADQEEEDAAMEEAEEADPDYEGDGALAIRKKKKKKVQRDKGDDHEEEIEAVEFTSYHPKRVLDIMPDAKPHPDKVVENSTLASVPAPPIVVTVWK